MDSSNRAYAQKILAKQLSGKSKELCSQVIQSPSRRQDTFVVNVEGGLMPC